MCLAAHDRDQSTSAPQLRLAIALVIAPAWSEARKVGLPREALDAFAQHATERIPLGRLGAADEVARAALFLASEDSTFVTGHELTVDGGMLAA